MGSVDSNETLYGGDPKFLSEINKLCETLIGQVLDHLKTLGRDEVRTQGLVIACLCFLNLSSYNYYRLTYLLVRLQLQLHSRTHQTVKPNPSVQAGWALHAHFCRL